MKTKETLVREYTVATPDGRAVKRTEHVEVEIDWPGERPEQWDGYGNAGQWVISEPANVTNHRCSEAESDVLDCSTFHGHF